MALPFKVIMDPAKYGYTVCPHCNGYGSSLKDPRAVNVCTMCDGSGLIKAVPAKENASGQQI